MSIIVCYAKLNGPKSLGSYARNFIASASSLLTSLPKPAGSKLNHFASQNGIKIRHQTPNTITSHLSKAHLWDRNGIQVSSRRRCPGFDSRDLQFFLLDSW